MPQVAKVMAISPRKTWMTRLYFWTRSNTERRILPDDVAVLRREPDPERSKGFDDLPDRLARRPDNAVVDGPEHGARAARSAQRVVPGAGSVQIGRRKITPARVLDLVERPEFVARHLVGRALAGDLAILAARSGALFGEPAGRDGGFAREQRLARLRLDFLQEGQRQIGRDQGGRLRRAFGAARRMPAGPERERQGEHQDCHCTLTW